MIDPTNLQFREITWSSNFSYILLRILIYLLLCRQTINFNSRWILEYTNCKKLWCLFRLKYYKIRYHLWYIDDIYLLHFKFMSYFDLWKSINMAANPTKVSCELWRSYYWDIPSWYCSSKIKSKIVKVIYVHIVL